MKNRVRSARAKLGLSQRALADVVGTSQQQIQRIETAKVAARLELATKLAEALKTPLALLFPGSAKPLQKLAKAYQERRNLRSEEIHDLENAGLEADTRAWYFQLRLRGHKESLQFEVAPSEQRWLFKKVQHEDSVDTGMTFIVFDTAHERVAVNARELVYCHFLFEHGTFVEEASVELSTSVEVFLAGDSSPLKFSVEPDDGDPEDEEDEGQFRGIFFSLDLHPDPADRVYFEDEDGEDVFLRTGDVALLKVPLFVIDPDYEIDEESDFA